MAYVRPYRVSETTTTVGTGTLTLAGAETGFSAFSATVANGDTVTYVIEAIDGSGAPSGNWEVTDGAWTTGGLLTRGTLRASSTGARVSFAVGTKRVFAIAPYDAVNLANDVTGTVAVANGGTGATTLTANNVILGNGTTAVQFVAPGSNGNVLTSNGTTWTSAASGASLLGVTDSATPFETSLGFEAGLNTTGLNNTFIGYQAGKDNTTGFQNTSVGSLALDANTTGYFNTAVGYSALGLNTIGVQNSALGKSALSKNTADANTAVGNAALQENTTGDSNTAVGNQSLFNNTTGSRNSTLGFQSMRNTTTGNDNIAVGYGALYDASVSNNSAVGAYAFYVLTTGSQNTATGQNAGRAVTTGQQNTLLGANAGNSGTNNLTTGSNNILLGYNAAASSATVSNETTIGNSSTTSARIFGDVKFLKSYTETVFAVVDAAGAVLDPNNGSIQTWTLGASRTPTQANWAAGQSITLMIDDGTAYTVTWTTIGVVWETNGGSAPTLATTGYTVIVLWKVGTTIYGARVGDA
jgi:hypothetical protein